MKLLESLTRRLLLALLCMALATCGGGADFAGNGQGGVGTGGTGITLGTVVGFGSVVVDGTAYNSETPNYYAAVQQSDTLPAVPGDVQLGAQVQLTLDAAGSPTALALEPALVGPVAQLGSDGFRVNGMRVSVNTLPAQGPLTYYAGLGGFADLAPGMLVEVHGLGGVDAQGSPYWQATLITQLAGGTSTRRLSGPITQLNNAGTAFQIGTTQVQLGSGAVVLPAGQRLAEGLWAQVWSDTPLTANERLMTASAVKLRGLQGWSGPARVSGLVANPAAQSLLLSGVPVDLTALGAAAGRWPAGSYLVVSGRVDSASGRLLASSADSAATGSSPGSVQLEGNITDYVSNANFRVRGVTVDASRAIASSGKPLALAEGQFLQLSGSVDPSRPNLVLAQNLTVLASPPQNGTLSLRGTVSNWNPATGRFSLLRSAAGNGQGNPSSNANQVTELVLASKVSYENGSASRLANGVLVEVEGANAGSLVQAYSISFVNGNPTSDSSWLQTRGTAYRVSGSQFMVNDLLIQLNGVAPQGGTLADGRRVTVQFVASGSANLAKSIVIER